MAQKDLNSKTPFGPDPLVLRIDTIKIGEDRNLYHYQFEEVFIVETSEEEKFESGGA